MSNLNQFIAGVKSGMAKSSFFTVELNLPLKLSNMEPAKSNMNKIILFCDQAQLPGISFSTNQVRSYGEFKEVPYEKLYEPIQLSFYVDSDMNVKKLFDSWMSLIQNGTTRDFNYADEYTTDKINIYVQDSMDQKKYCVSLNKAYPKTISPIQLDYAAKEVMKLQVTIVYKFAQVSQEYSPSQPAISSSQIGMSSFASPDQVSYGIPEEYFNNFDEFQGQAANVDFSYGVKSIESVENLGESIGLGGVFV